MHEEKRADSTTSAFQMIGCVKRSHCRERIKALQYNKALLQLLENLS